MTVIVPDAGEVRLTRQGRRHLGARARTLRDTIIPRLAVELRGGRDRDDSALADHERATTELARICAVLATARPAEAIPDDPDVVELGEAVTISVDGSAERWVIVHPSEAAAGAGRVSARSPLGRALLGCRVGDEVEVAAPGGPYRCVIESATRTKTARSVHTS